jgi:4-amino-4-deoxy-L-arabinose transferase-like glycosyltransferase
MLALRRPVWLPTAAIAARPGLAVAAFAAMMYLPWLGAARTFTFHESHVAQGAREMLATGDWLIPRIGGRPWLEKPPLPQWMVAFSGLAFGEVNEWSARLPAAMFAIFGLLAFTKLIAAHRGDATAVAAGLLLATTTSIITYARLAEPDIFLWAIVVAALAAFAGNHVEPVKTPRSAFAFFALLGATQLAKGPLFGAAMVLAPVTAWYVVHRGRNWKWCLSPFMLLAAAISVAWPVAVLVRYPEALELWKTHLLGRLDAETAYNPKPFWYYFTTLPWQAAPALLFALPAIPKSLRQAWRTPFSLDRFLWLWFAGQLLLLSAASGKHHHYAIYCLPPIAVWAADGLKRWAALIGWLWGFVAYRVGSICLLSAALGAVAVLGERKGILPARETLLVGGFFLAAMVLLARACSRHDDRTAFAFLAVALAGMLLYVNTIWLYRTDIYRADGELATRIRERTPADCTVIVYAIDPARLLLDLRRPVLQPITPEELRTAMEEHPEAEIITALFYREQVDGVAIVEETDRTPLAKWPGRPLSHVVVYRSIAVKR